MPVAGDPLTVLAAAVADLLAPVAHGVAQQPFGPLPGQPQPADLVERQRQQHQLLALLQQQFQDAALLTPIAGGPSDSSPLAASPRPRVSASSPRSRARTLLLSYLDSQQRADYEQRGWFFVQAASGQRYKLWNGAVLRVRPDGSHERHLCVIFAPGYNTELPVEDKIIAQLLLLRTDEPRFLALANGDIGLDVLHARLTAALRSSLRLDGVFFGCLALLLALSALSIGWGFLVPPEQGSVLALLSGLLGLRLGVLHRRGRRLLERVEAEAQQLRDGVQPRGLPGADVR